MQKQYKIKNIKMDKKYLETIKNPKRNNILLENFYNLTWFISSSNIYFYFAAV